MPILKFNIVSMCPALGFAAYWSNKGQFLHRMVRQNSNKSGLKAQ